MKNYEFQIASINYEAQQGNSYLVTLDLTGLQFPKPASTTGHEEADGVVMFNLESENGTHTDMSSFEMAKDASDYFHHSVRFTNYPPDSVGEQPVAIMSNHTLLISGNQDDDIIELKKVKADVGGMEAVDRGVNIRGRKKPGATKSMAFVKTEIGVVEINSEPVPCIVIDIEESTIDQLETELTGIEFDDYVEGLPIVLNYWKSETKTKVKIGTVGFHSAQ